ncbi:uncharacterized protein LOC108735863 isoform X2 [Agrilus planipennis]|uniref:Uncharacterized protein LOC108735863 isoform X2 n=1 Tax=Agrilus planipennis TaxID=224129 RepID=A0A1W4WSV0_AGRPL|nr:uncharacterized protein LOC108735863 isoform X2 [Agrilus planipennis]
MINSDLSKWIFAGIIIYIIAIILVICIRMFVITKVICPYSSCGIHCYNCRLENCEKYCRMDKSWFNCRRLPKCTCKCFLPRCYCLCCEFIFENEEDLAKDPVVIGDP